MISCLESDEKLLEVVTSPRCFVPWFNNEVLSFEWKKALWDNFVAARPRHVDWQPHGQGQPVFIVASKPVNRSSSSRFT